MKLRMAKLSKTKYYTIFEKLRYDTVVTAKSKPKSAISFGTHLQSFI